MIHVLVQQQRDLRDLATRHTVRGMGDQRVVTAIGPGAAEHGVDDVLFARTIVSALES